MLQHDNAPVHSAKRIKRYLEDQNIEVLNAKLNANSSINDIRTKVQDIWANLPQRLLLAVIASMRTRMKEVVKSSGAPIKY